MWIVPAIQLWVSSKVESYAHNHGTYCRLHTHIYGAEMNPEILPNEHQKVAFIELEYGQLLATTSQASEHGSFIYC